MKVLVGLGRPKGAKREERMESTVTVSAPSTERARSYAMKRWPNHDVLGVTEAELQPDGRWTFPRSK